MVGTKMKAQVYTKYGGPEVLSLQEVDKPRLGKNQLMVKIRAIAIAPLDDLFLHGSNWVIHLMQGIGSPRNPTIGQEFSGEVTEVGSNVTTYKVGDHVMGGALIGAYAECIAVDVGVVTKKPSGMSFEEAAGLTVTAVCALQSLRDLTKLKSGQTVLVNGASGSVGVYVVQMAKEMGAKKVTAVCSTAHLDLVKSLGADEVIDYTKEDIFKRGEMYDVVINCTPTGDMRRWATLLSPKGSIALVGSTKIMKESMRGKILGMTSGKRFFTILTEVKSKDLEYNVKLFEKKSLTVPIGQTFSSVEQIPDAIRSYNDRPGGKVVVTFN